MSDGRYGRGGRYYGGPIHRRQSFDAIIIGAGPSAAGLLYGLLSRILKNDLCVGDVEDDDCGATETSSRNIRIAIIERGKHHDEDALVLLDDSRTEFTEDCCAQHDTKKSTSKPLNDPNKNLGRNADDAMVTADEKAIQSTRKNRFVHPHPSTHSLRHWFTAAHFTSRPTENMHCHQHLKQPSKTRGNDPQSTGGYSDTAFERQTSTSQSPPPSTILHTTIPQQCLNDRIIDVPTGSGWGGTTNIHAGLVVEPFYGHRDARNNDTGQNRITHRNRCAGAGDFDTWPGKWKGGKMIREMIHDIQGAMMESDSLRSIDPFSPERGKPLTSNPNNLLHRNDSFQWMTRAPDEYGKFQHIVTSSTTLPEECGKNCDVTKEEGKGFGYTESKRVNYFASLIEPLMCKYPQLESCVTFLSGLEVERILIGVDQGAAHAWGVEVKSMSDGRVFIIESRKEIFVCAGAIGSPSLLMVSGVGRHDDLIAAGIRPWYELPSVNDQNLHNVYRNLPVGHNLRDHILLPRVLITPFRQEKSTLSNNSIRGYTRLCIPEIKTMDGTTSKIELQLADGLQMDTMIVQAAALAMRRKLTLSISNAKWEVPIAWITCSFYLVRFILRTIFDCRFIQNEIRLRTASINVCVLNPKSIGMVKIICHRNKDDSSPTRLSECRILIDPAYLSDSHDVDALWAGWSASLKLKQQWFNGCIEILPGLPFVAVFHLVSCMLSLVNILVLGCIKKELAEGQNRPAWFSSYAAEFTNPYYHWCGTCSMGEDVIDDIAGADEGCSFVVDEHLCVRGVFGLRVCDASVFPRCISAPPALTCAALGRAASEFVFKGKLKEDVVSTAV